MSYNPYSLNGKTILITGASSGIGRATAIECSKLGAQVIITGRNAERLQQTFDHLEGAGHVQIIADLTSQVDLETLVKQLPNIDGVVNNAGISRVKLIGFYKESILEEVFKTNVFSPMLLTKSLLRAKKIKENGSVVFTSSIAAYHNTFGNGIYGSSKAALTRYMHYCVKELTPKHIRVNTVHPGMIETPLIHQGDQSDEDLINDMKNYYNGRYGRPEEVAWAIIYLLSDAAAWITGTELKIDGGVVG